MRKISFLLLSALIGLSACKESFKKGQKGLEFKNVGGGSGAGLKAGDIMQLHVGQYYSTGKADSMLSDSRSDRGPMLQPFDSTSMPPEYFAIFKGLKKGDSLVIRILVDSVMKQNPSPLPPFMKKGNYLLTTIKLMNVFATREQADSAGKAEMALAEVRMKKKSEEQLLKDDKILTDYFAKNNIKVQKAPEGAYVEILQAGTGAVIDTSVVVKTNYTGKTLEGKTFDSNTDPAFNHTEPLNVNMTNDMSLGSPVIAGWKDGMKLLNKGAKAKFYIPSPLAYGAQPPSPDIPANGILVFEVEVLDILNKVQAKAAAQALQAKMMEMQKRYMDSVQKTQADTTMPKK